MGRCRRQDDRERRQHAGAVTRFVTPWRAASWFAAICALVCALFRPAAAQSLDPRAYSNVPIGANFVSVSYSYESGGVSVDPSLPVTNGSATVDIETIGYSRALNAWGQSGILNLALPYAEVSAHADVAGQPRSRNVSGPGDAALRAAMNFYGAPALSQKEFAAWQQQTIVGASLLVTAPLGQYDPSKLVNISTNRWSFRPELGLSVASDRHWTFELAAGATFYTDNNNFLNGHTRSQKPLYETQGHVIYYVKPGFWLSAGGTYYEGGRTSVNGKVDNNLEQDTRWGVTISKSIDPHNSIKFNYSNGLTARVGTNFQAATITWQYAWFSQ